MCREAPTASPIWPRPRRKPPTDTPIYPVSGGPFALGALALDARLAAAQQGLAVTTLEFCEILFDSHELGLS